MKKEVINARMVIEVDKLDWEIEIDGYVCYTEAVNFSEKTKQVKVIHVEQIDACDEWFDEVILDDYQLEKAADILTAKFLGC